MENHDQPRGSIGTWTEGEEERKFSYKVILAPFRCLKDPAIVLILAVVIVLTEIRELTSSLEIAIVHSTISNY